MKKIKKFSHRFGVVGTWYPKHNKEEGELGGVMPKYLTPKDEAIGVAKSNKRVQDFIDAEKIEFYLCEIVIKPIRKVNKRYLKR